MDKTTINGTLPQIIQRIEGLMAVEMTDAIYDCEIKKHREKRSLTANAYYWVLLGQYATYERKSKIRLHNEMLQHYGQDLLDDDGSPVFDLLPEDEDWKLREEHHVRPFEGMYKDGQWLEPKDVDIYGEIFKMYVKVKGSKEYNSLEMAALIDGLIADIQGSGAPIETMTPGELATLKGYGYEPQKA